MKWKPAAGLATGNDGAGNRNSPAMTALGFELTVALRFLREGRMQTALIVGGAAIGVAVIFFITAVLTGVQGDLIKRVTGAQPHIVIKPPEEIVEIGRAHV